MPGVRGGREVGVQELRPGVAPRLEGVPRLLQRVIAIGALAIRPLGDYGEDAGPVILVGVGWLTNRGIPNDADDRSRGDGRADQA